MLEELSIQNFAIIDDLQLTLAPGMTVLSGETGAGKSILIDALGLLLGDKADADAVRDGQPRAEISAVFNLTDAHAARAWLAQQERDDDDNCVLRRVISREGRSRNWINGSPANARDLKALGEHLVDIHGQHAHQSLLRRGAQRELLDDYGNHHDARAALAECCETLRAVNQRIEQLEGRDADGTSRQELLSYQVRELEALDLQPGELDAIEAEHKRLANAQQLIDAGSQALALLYEADQGSAVDVLGNAERLLQGAAALTDDFAAAAQATADARIQTQEAADSLRRTLDGLEIDPARLAELDNRLAALQDLARKHHCEPRALPEHLQALTRELEELRNADATLIELREQRAELESNYRKQAEALHHARSETAARLAAGVTDVIRELGMPKGVFEVQVQHDPERAPAPHGADTITLLVSANPGQAPRPLERVASGGELSRISLAIQVIAAADARVPTLIFDEVDAGIGGGVAEIVGRLLHRLGGNQQALCVTHLPQVAAQADAHLFVRKEEHGGATVTRIDNLSPDHRVEELARMLGGLDITERTRAHAREMMGLAGAQ